MGRGALLPQPFRRTAPVPLHQADVSCLRHRGFGGFLGPPCVEGAVALGERRGSKEGQNRSWSFVSFGCVGVCRTEEGVGSHRGKPLRSLPVAGTRVARAPPPAGAAAGGRRDRGARVLLCGPDPAHPPRPLGTAAVEASSGVCVCVCVCARAHVKAERGSPGARRALLCRAGVLCVLCAHIGFSLSFLVLPFYPLARFPSLEVLSLWVRPPRHGDENGCAELCAVTCGPPGPPSSRSCVCADPKATAQGRADTPRSPFVGSMDAALVYSPHPGLQKDGCRVGRPARYGTKKSALLQCMSKCTPGSWHVFEWSTLEGQHAAPTQQLKGKMLPQCVRLFGGRGIHIAGVCVAHQGAR